MPLLDEIVAAHGGLEAWRSAGRIEVRARVGGLLPRTRVPGFRPDARLEASVGEVHAVAHDYPNHGERAVFEADGSVRIETIAGAVVEGREDPRAAFFGRSGLRRNLRWDRLDFAYFAGYAWWNYLNHPLLLARDDVAVSEGEPISTREGEWSRLDAVFPPGLPTHSPRQSFFYDGELRLRRHDYVAEIVGGWAHAAHLCEGHREAGGLLFPTRRRVVPVGPGERPLPGPTLVALDLIEIEVVARDRP